MVVIVVIVVAVLVGLAVGALAWFLPIFDPAAPRAKATTIKEEVARHPGLATFLHARLDPESLAGLALTVALALILLGAIGAGALLVMVNHNAGLARWDMSAARWGSEHATTASTNFLRFMSQFGGTMWTVLAAVIVSIVEWRRTRNRNVLLFTLVVIVGQVIIHNTVKVVVDRARPDINQLTGFSGSSFPSGHSATAASTWAAIALLLGRGRSRPIKALLAAGAGAIAAAVATTRVLLGVHWLTDVIAGLVIGWGWFALVSIAFGGRVLSFGQPAKVAAEAAEAADVSGADGNNPYATVGTPRRSSTGPSRSTKLSQ